MKNTITTFYRIKYYENALMVQIFAKYNLSFSFNGKTLG